MKISMAKIQNFRLLKNLKLTLEDNLSLVLGKNNTGKTSILSIFNKFIGENTNSFTYDDLNISFRQELFESIRKNSEWIPANGNGIYLTIYIDYNENDNLSTLSSFMVDDLSPEKNKIILKFEYSIDQTKIAQLNLDFFEFKEKHPNKEIDMKDCFEGFMKTKHSKYFKLLIKSLEYDYETNEEIQTSYSLIDRNDKALKQLISFKYISARRLVTNKESDGSLSHLSSKYYEKNESLEIHRSAIKDFEDTLITTDQQLDAVYKSLFESVLGTLKKFGGIKENETSVQIISSLQQRNLIKSNTTVVYNDENHLLPESYNGLGYLNLLNIIFELETILSDIRMDGQDDVKPADINLLFIEEPEAHTHPQMQYVFIKNIKEILRTGTNGTGEKNIINLQTVVTTHSSHIVSECDFDDIKYLFKSKKKEVIAKDLKLLELQYKGEKEFDKKQFKFLKQYLTLNKAELFFADKAIFIEGDTERILIPAMMKKIDQEINDDTPLLSQNISLVEVGNYSHIFDPFIDFLGIKTLIITDIDSAMLERTDGIENEKDKISISGCKVIEGNVTTNYSLKHFHSQSLEELSKDEIRRENYELTHFKSLNFEDKVLEKEEGKWIKSPEGNLALVYQITESNINNEDYAARSFEDAFFHINRQFIIDSKETFRGLKNASFFTEMTDEQYTYSSFDLAEKCVSAKPSLAMDILLNSKKEGTKEFSNWSIPLYIEEGLKWLKKD